MHRLFDKVTTHLSIKILSQNEEHACHQTLHDIINDIVYGTWHQIWHLTWYHYSTATNCISFHLTYFPLVLHFFFLIFALFNYRVLHLQKDQLQQQHLLIPVSYKLSDYGNKTLCHKFSYFCKPLLHHSSENIIFEQALTYLSSFHLQILRQETE